MPMHSDSYPSTKLVASADQTGNGAKDVVESASVARKEPEEYDWDAENTRKRNSWLLGLFIGVTLLLGIAGFLMWRQHHRALSADSDTQLQDIHQRENKGLNPDIYGCTVACLIRDLRHVATGKGDRGIRVAHLISTFLALALNIFLQVFVMWQFKKFVTAKWVSGIRNDYSDYEEHMYPGHTALTVNGRHRGTNSKYFQPENFDTLDGDLKERVCSIPFSQKYYFGAVLYIWTLTVIAEIRECIALLSSLVIFMPTTNSMSEAFYLESEEGVVEAGSNFNSGMSPRQLREKEHDHSNFQSKKVVVAALPVHAKAVIGVCVVLPRGIIALVLLWLGTRFMAATNDFVEMVLNAVALEFLISLKSLLYMTIVPERSKRNTANLEIMPSNALRTKNNKLYEPATYWSNLVTFLWAIAGLVWVVFYTFQFQTVLPHYRWDVNELCTPYLEKLYS